MNYRNPELRSALAAEYVLGTLQGPARRRFERLLHADFALRRDVQRWQNDLYPGLIDALPEKTPRPQVWQAIRRQTRELTAPRREPERTGFWDNLPFWHVWSALATAAALALALYLTPGLFPEPVPPAPEYLAIVNDNASQPAWLVEVDQSNQRLAVQALRAQALAADRSFELWLLPGANQPPRSLGLVPARGTAQLALPAELLPMLAGAAGLAVSLEPSGGSPTGLPTGPVLYQGSLVPAG